MCTGAGDVDLLPGAAGHRAQRSGGECVRAFSVRVRVGLARALGEFVNQQNEEYPRGGFCLRSSDDLLTCVHYRYSR